MSWPVSTVSRRRKSYRRRRVLKTKRRRLVPVLRERRPADNSAFPPDYSKVKDATLHGVPRKRQLPAGRVSGIALPIVAEAINGAAKAQAYATGTGYYDSGPSLIRSTLGWPKRYRGTPYPLGLLRAFRPPVSQSPVGSILSFGNLVGPSTAILRSVNPLYRYGLNRFTVTWIRAAVTCTGGLWRNGNDKHR